MNGQTPVDLAPSANGDRDAEVIHTTDSSPSFTDANAVESETDAIKRPVREEGNTSSQVKLKRKRVTSLVVGIVLAVSAISGLISWLQAGQHESTDDAFIEEA